MSISIDSYDKLTENIQRVNTILKAIVNSRTNLDEKAVEADSAKVSGQGDKVDVSA